MKLGFIVDSSCGLTQNEAKKLGFFYLPLYFKIDGKDYADGVDIDQKKYYENINISNDVTTSATPPAEILKVFKEASKKFDEVIVYAISKEISSQVSNLKTFAKDFKNIHVLDSLVLSCAIIEEIKNIKEYSLKNNNLEDIIAYANNESGKWFGYCIPKTLDWLVKGGRINKSIAAMANLIKIIPIIQLRNGKLEKAGKGRVFSKIFAKCLKNIKKEKQIDKLFFLSGTIQDDDIYQIKKIAQKNEKELIFTHIPPIVSNHTGPETILLLSKK